MEVKKKETNYGSLFRSLRLDLGFTIIETAKGIMSKSGLSKFERGESNITISKFILLLERIGITLEEFSFYCRGFNQDELGGLINKIEIAVDHKDSDFFFI